MARPIPAPSSNFGVLFVCTGNICRSALAEHLGRAYLESQLGPEAGSMRLESAGTSAVVGATIHPDTAAVLTGFGGDPQGHVAQPLNPRLVEAADLVLTMTRAHRAGVLGTAPRALARVFTLREAMALVRGLSSSGSRPTGGDLPERARSLVRAMAAARPRRPSGRSDDVPDPIGRSLEFQQEVGDLVSEALLEVLGALVRLRDPAVKGV